MTQFLISLAVDDAALALQWKCDCSVLRSKQTKGKCSAADPAFGICAHRSSPVMSEPTPFSSLFAI